MHAPITSMIEIFIGGACGSLIRYGIYHLFSVQFQWPRIFSTYIVNILGTLGSVGTVALIIWGSSHIFLLFTSTTVHTITMFSLGLWGGVSTFSTFIMEIVLAWMRLNNQNPTIKNKLDTSSSSIANPITRLFYRLVWIHKRHHYHLTIILLTFLPIVIAVVIVLIFSIVIISL